jgi:hypothetical protein
MADIFRVYTTQKLQQNRRIQNDQKCLDISERWIFETIVQPEDIVSPIRYILSILAGMSSVTLIAGNAR